MQAQGAGGYSPGSTKHIELNWNLIRQIALSFLIFESANKETCKNCRCTITGQAGTTWKNMWKNIWKNLMAENDLVAVFFDIFCPFLCRSP
jgi:hypothetical protein